MGATTKSHRYPVNFLGGRKHLGHVWSGWPSNAAATHGRNQQHAHQCDDNSSLKTVHL